MQYSAIPPGQPENTVQAVVSVFPKSGFNTFLVQKPLISLLVLWLTVWHVVRTSATPHKYCVLSELPVRLFLKLAKPRNFLSRHSHTCGLKLRNWIYMVFTQSSSLCLYVSHGVDFSSMQPPTHLALSITAEPARHSSESAWMSSVIISCWNIVQRWWWKMRWNKLQLKQCHHM